MAVLADEDPQLSVEGEPQSEKVSSAKIFNLHQPGEVGIEEISLGNDKVPDLQDREGRAEGPGVCPAM